VIAALAFVVSSAGPAAAHASLVRSDPADSSVLDSAPDTIELTFNEPVSADGSTVELVDVDGNVHDTEIIGHGAGDSSLVVRLGEIPDGLYSLRWTAFSSSDGHVTRGMLVWGFGADADLSQASFPSTSRPVPKSEVIARWVLIAGLAVLLGGLVIEALVLDSLKSRFTSKSDLAWHSSADSTTSRALVLGARAAFASSAYLVVHQVWTLASSTGQGIVSSADASLTSTTWGQASILRLVALWAAMSFARVGRGSALARRIVMLSAMVAVVAQASTGHSAGTDAGLFLVANDSIHLASSTAWLGGVLVLWLVLRTGVSNRPVHIGGEALRAFSPFAATAVSVALVTGLLAVGTQISSLDALIASLYGRTLLIKLGLVGIVLLFALVTRRGYERSGSDRRIGREAIAGALVLAAVAVLSSSVPANDSTWSPSVSADARQLAVVHDDIQLGLSIAPNVPGQNLILIDAGSTRRPVPAAIDRVLARIAPLDMDVAPSTVVVEPTDRPGEYQIPTTAFAVPGDYEVAVVVRRAGMPDITTAFKWTVASPPGARGVTVSDTGIDRYASALGLLGALLVLGVLIRNGALLMLRERRLRGVESFLESSDKTHPKVDP